MPTKYPTIGDLDKPFHRPECECGDCEEWRAANYQGEGNLMLTLRPTPDSDPTATLRRAVLERCPVTLDPEQCKRILGILDHCHLADLLAAGVRGCPDDVPGVMPGKEG